jgi:hypothetical protein
MNMLLVGFEFSLPDFFRYPSLLDILLLLGARVLSLCANVGSARVVRSLALVHPLISMDSPVSSFE